MLTLKIVYSRIFVSLSRNFRADLTASGCELALMPKTRGIANLTQKTNRQSVAGMSKGSGIYGGFAKY